MCVVDDDKYYNQLVTQIIEQNTRNINRPLKVLSFRNGYDCLQNGINPTLVFLDFYLSSDNDITETGLDVLNKLKKRNPRTKVVFMSHVHDWEQFKDDLKAQGALDFIKKDEYLPLNIKNILDEIIK